MYLLLLSIWSCVHLATPQRAQSRQAARKTPYFNRKLLHKLVYIYLSYFRGHAPKHCNHNECLRPKPKCQKCGIASLARARAHARSLSLARSLARLTHSLTHSLTHVQSRASQREFVLCMCMCVCACVCVCVCVCVCHYPSFPS
jgi:hypothetical protein